MCLPEFVNVNSEVSRFYLRYKTRFTSRICRRLRYNLPTGEIHGTTSMENTTVFLKLWVKKSGAKVKASHIF
jgi:hypothetical protein